jgi:hypothetical protein
MKAIGRQSVLICFFRTLLTPGTEWAVNDNFHENAFVQFKSNDLLPILSIVSTPAEPQVTLALMMKCCERHILNW